MTSRKVAFAARGNRPLMPQLPPYAMADETETDIMAVRRVIEHTSGYAVAVCEHKGSAKNDQGRVTSARYDLTLGTPMRSGGYSVSGQLHVVIWDPAR
jgi:hypothetical protein